MITEVVLESLKRIRLVIFSFVVIVNKSLIIIH